MCAGQAASLLDAKRTIGQPNELTLIFGRPHHAVSQRKLQTVIEDLHLPNPVIRSHYRKAARLPIEAVTSDS